MKGLHKATGYYQTQQAKVDWAAIAKFAHENGLGAQADKLAPKQGWGWRCIDKRIAKLRAVLEANELNFTLPSRGQH